MSRSLTKVLLGIVMLSFFLAGFLCQAQEAAAQKCNDVTKTNYKSCNETGGCSNCKVTALRADGKVTVSEAQAVYNCTKNAACRSGAQMQAKYDLNNDGKVDTADYAIAQKCVGCSKSPSPFK
jgi:hypothetical protein